MSGKQLHDDALALLQFAQGFHGNGPNGYCSDAHLKWMNDNWRRNDAEITRIATKLWEAKYGGGK